MAWINYEGILFNPTVNGAKPFKEFAEHEKHHGLNEKQLREVWILCGGKDKKKEATPPADGESVTG